MSSRPATPSGLAEAVKTCLAMPSGQQADIGNALLSVGAPTTKSAISTVRTPGDWHDVGLRERRSPLSGCSWATCE